MTMDKQRVSSFAIFEGGTSVFLEQYTHISSHVYAHRFTYKHIVAKSSAKKITCLQFRILVTGIYCEGLDLNDG